MRFAAVLFLTCLLAARLDAATSGELADWVRTIQAVQSEGRGNVEASRAWQQIAALHAKQLPRVLAAMDGANNYALNWFRESLSAGTRRRARHGTRWHERQGALARLRNDERIRPGRFQPALHSAERRGRLRVHRVSVRHGAVRWERRFWATGRTMAHENTCVA